MDPSLQPSIFPSFAPSNGPSLLPSFEPSYVPSTAPSLDPSMIPSNIPSLNPSIFPSSIPSILPSVISSLEPSTGPTGVPSFLPSSLPSIYPSFSPSDVPTFIPSVIPSSFPTDTPSKIPSHYPSSAPTSSCESSQSTFDLKIFTDDFGAELSWSLVGIDGSNVSNDTIYASNDVYTYKVCLSNLVSYNFTIFDAYGDGMCCDDGIGNYSITLDGIVKKQGGDFESQESTILYPGESLPSLSPSLSGSPTISAVPSYSPVWSPFLALSNSYTGESDWDEFGSTISLSSNGGLMAVGSIKNDNSVSDSGSVRTYQAGSTSPVTIRGSFSNGHFGKSVSLSANGIHLVVGEPRDGTFAGDVSVYSFTGTAWNPLGNTLSGENANDRFGTSVSMAENGLVFAVGAPLNGGSGTNRGSVRVYEWSGSDWTQRGVDIDGKSDYEFSGRSVSISGNGNSVAIGSDTNGNSVDVTHVRVYDWDGSSWSQKGLDMVGEVVSDYFGYSVSLSYDGTVVAIGARMSDGNGIESGCVQVLEVSESSWGQVGSKIYGTDPYDHFGEAVSLSPDGLVLVVGAPNATASNLGHAKVYQRIDDTWVQLGNDLIGSNSGDYFGSAVEISLDASKVAVGGIGNDDNGSNSGHVRLYNIHVPVPPGWSLGFCRKPDGSDQNDGVYRLDSERYTAHHESIKRCYIKCRDYVNPNKTGCEVIFNGLSAKGCYLHTSELHPAGGNGANHHYCWVGTMD